MAITGARTGVNILTVANITEQTWAPRQAAHNSDGGAALTYDGTRAVCVPVVLANEAISIAVTNAGAGVRTGTFRVWVGR